MTSTLRPLVALGGLPAALLEAARDDHPRPAGEALAHVLRHLAPADDVEERGRLLPLLGLAVLPAAIHSEPEARRRLPGRGEAQLGVPCDVADEGDGVPVSH